MNRYPRRLIEVDLPIKRISVHARREKSIRHGHISTLHIWWARRPLAACRAVILASLWPDPAPGPDDPPCPPAFLTAARTWMTAWAIKHAEKASKESFPRLKAIQDNPAMLDERPLELRNALLDFIADFANWDNSTDKDYLETSRALVQAAHVALGGAPGTRPLVVDPFAGGGAIPLEALRVGADAFASDLNPVAVLLNKVVLEYIPKYGQRLADEVRKWGEWIKQEAEKELAEFYPKDPDGATPIAYLWARTIQCEGPGCGAEVPLIRSLWLVKKANRSVALQLVAHATAKRVDFQIVVKQRDGWVSQDDERSRIPDPGLDGTMKRGSATCPCCGYTTPVARVKEQLKTRRGGANDARLTCVVKTGPNDARRDYRVGGERDLKACRAASTELGKRNEERVNGLSLVPDEPLPPAGSLGFRVQPYGMTTWADLFSRRQLLVLTTLARLVREVGEKLRASRADSAFAAAVQTVLAQVVNKQADYDTSLCTWHYHNREKVNHTFGRQAIPVVWDFVEPVFFGSGAGSWPGLFDWTTQALENPVELASAATIQQANAVAHPLPSDSAHALVTDPPYLDAVPYSDLSDFFYVWFKRTLPREVHAGFAEPLAPKDGECIVDEPRGKDRAYFEATMKQSMTEGRRVLSPDGIGVVVFAHKSTAGWEAQLQAMVDSNWIITGSWPIDTEMGTRLRAHESAALASSVHLVCRPRENPDGTVRSDDVGDWRDVLGELPRRIHDWMPRLAAEGVVGADAIFACLGPALEVFSRYSRVEKSSGEAVTLKEYLEQVWAVVSTEALSMIFDDADAAGLEPDARLTAMWLWTVGSPKGPGGQSSSHGDDKNDENEAGDDGDEEDGKPKVSVKGFSLEFDAARKIAQGLGIHLDRSPSIVEVKGDQARLLPVAERTPYLFGKDTAPGTGSPTRPRRTKQRKLFEELEAVEAATSGTGIAGSVTSRPRPGQTALDRVHQGMILFGANRGEALKQFLVDDGVGRDAKFWKLAQALSALYPTTTDEKRWVDGVLARKKGLGL
jgi:adenine-specific DNA methylase